MTNKQNDLDSLILKLCPNGVVFKELGEVCEGATNANWSLNKDRSFKYIDLTSVNRITHTIDNTQIINSETAPSRAQKMVRDGDVIFGTTRPTLRRFSIIDSKYDGQICSTGFCVLRPKKTLVLTDFIFHILGTSTFNDYVKATQKGASYPAISDSEVKKYKIPLPPLDIQKEIVKILNSFTELEAELEARKKQYRHYREELMKFEDNVELKELGEIGTLIRGSGLQKNDFVDNGVGCIHYGQIYTYYGTYTDKTKSFVSEELAKRLKKVETGDLVIACTSENVEDVCKVVAWLGEKVIVTGGHATILKHKQNPKYLAYYFQTQDFFDQKKKYARGAKVIEISAKDLAKIRIPIPGLNIQQRIVNILDKFEALVNDISIGLPAELKARRTQYEYYRNKLLTFREYDG